MCHTLWLHSAQAPGAPPQRPPLRGRPALPRPAHSLYHVVRVTPSYYGFNPRDAGAPARLCRPPLQGGLGAVPAPSWARPGRPAPRAPGRCSCHNSSPPRLSAELGPGAGAAALPLLRGPALRSAPMWRSRRGRRNRVLARSGGCRGAMDERKVGMRPCAGGQKVM